MNQFSGVRPTHGKIVLSGILAAFFAFVQPWALTFQLILPMPGIGLYVIMTAILYAWCGILPVAVLTLLGSFFIMITFGMANAVILLPMTLLPAWAIMTGLRSRDAFFGQLKRVLICSLAGTSAAVVLAGIVHGQDMIASLLSVFVDFFEQNKAVLIEQVREMGGFGDQLTLELFEEAYSEFFKSMQSYYEQYLIANQLSGAIWTSASAVLLGNWLLARRGEATSESFKGISEWHLPSGVTLGLLLMLAVSAILLNFPIRGNTALFVIVCSLNRTAFAIQGFAANDRRMRAQGASRSRRRGIVILIVMIQLMGVQVLGIDAFTLLALAGGCSAMFGRKGSARPAIDRIKEMLNNDDE